MKIVICGSPQAGQQELFSILAGVPLEQVRQKPLEVQLGSCAVKDPRITRLTELYRPKKTTYTRIEYTLLPDFTTQGPAKNLIFNELRKADEICWVVPEEDAPGSVEQFLAELVIGDLVLVEKRLENLEKETKGKRMEEKEKEKALMLLCKTRLEKEQPLLGLELTDEQQKLTRTFQFFSLKPLVVVVNVAEDKIKDRSAIDELNKKYPFPAVQLSAGLEAEISQLPEAERAEFMKELGVDEPAVEKMNRVVYQGLGLISFFTVGEDEVRAWPVRRGASAPEAGSVIHSDIEKGFVRAEHFTYDDLVALGSEAKVKEAGKFSLKGKDYPVADGDILSFRFNV